jgi:hypothetical protein
VTAARPVPDPWTGAVTDHIVVGDRVLLDVSFRAARARLGILARDGVLLGASEEAYGEGITGLVRRPGARARLSLGEARLAHAGPLPQCMPIDAATCHADQRCARLASSLPIVQLAATASRAPSGRRSRDRLSPPRDLSATPMVWGTCEEEQPSRKPAAGMPAVAIEV